MTKDSKSSTIDAPLVKRATFDAAVSAGDLKTIQAFFAQSHVRNEVEETNAYIIETRAAADSDATTFTLRDGSCPWFRQPSRSSYYTSDVPFVTAAQNGHVDVIEWLFSCECASFMGATLAFLLPSVAQFDIPRSRDKWRRDAAILDRLFTSFVFCDLIDDEKKQFVLDQAARVSQNFELIDVAIAHGARVNETLDGIAKYAEYRTTDCIAKFVDVGALLVGEDLLQPQSDYCRYGHAEAFVKSGAGWGAGLGMVLLNAADDTNDRAVEKLLAHGFVDVDVRDDNGKTPLMRVSSLDPFDLNPQFPDFTIDIAEWLLIFCDVNLTDNMGATALHYAAESSKKMTKLLLANGADPNARDDNGLAPFAYLDLDHVFRWETWQDFVKLFLEKGFDPFAIAIRRDTTFVETPAVPVEEGEIVSDEEHDEAGLNEPQVEEEALADAENGDEGLGDAQDEDERGNGYRSLYDHLLEVDGGLEFIRQNAQYFERDGVVPNSVSSSRGE